MCTIPPCYFMGRASQIGACLPPRCACSLQQPCLQAVKKEVLQKSDESVERVAWAG